MSLDSKIVDHLSSMRRYAMTLTRNATDADDVVQDAVEKALRMFAQYDAAQPMRPWLHRIVHNVFIDRYRRRVTGKRTKVQPVHVAIGREVDQIAGDLRRDVAALEAFQVLGEAANAIKPEMYEVLHRHEVRGESYDEIASAMGIPYCTAVTRLHRARRQLKDALGEFSTLDGARVDTARREPAERVQADADSVDSVVRARY